MTASLSGLGIEHEIQLTQHAAQVLANQYKQDLPFAGHEILLKPDYREHYREHKTWLDVGNHHLAIQNLFGKLVLVSSTHTCEQWPEVFGLDSGTGLPITDYKPATSIPVRKEQGERVAYVNSFYDRNNTHSRRTFETDVKPEEYRGYLIFHRVGWEDPVELGTNVFDVVKPDLSLANNGGLVPLIGICVGQTAGPSAARKTVDRLMDAPSSLLPSTANSSKGRKP